MSQTPKRGLGRGFETLLPQTFDKTLLLPNDDERIQKLGVDVVAADAGQPRRHFDEKALHELAESIREHGILLPLVVKTIGSGKYQIVAGERRWRAAKIAGLKTVPAIVRSLKELQQLEIALVENIQRVDLSPLEQAASIHRLHDQFSIAYDTIAKRLGKASSTVNNIVRLLQLPEAALNALANKDITEGHARAILALKGKDKEQAHLLSCIIKQGWTVRQAERYVTSLKDGVIGATALTARVKTETPATKAFSARIGAPVHVKRTAKGGRLEITFVNDDQLDKILKLLG